MERVDHARETSLGERRTRIALGALGGGFYAVHAAHQLADGHPEDLLWACHLGAILVSAGLFLRSPLANAIGFLWLTIGLPLWILDLSLGGEFIATSPFTHVGGLALGAAGLRLLGMPRGAWWKAVLAFLALQELCRRITPERENVNVAFSVWAGWEDAFPSYPAYMALLAGGAAAVFLVEERIARWLRPAGKEDRHAG
jgi:hypothetical protein